MSNRQRQVADSSQKGRERYRMYKNVLERCAKAKENGFYLEAIALIESIMADRLESYLIRITSNTNYAFKPLGSLIKGLRAINDLQMPIAEIENWKKARNQFLHEMAKIEDGQYEDFSTRYSAALQCVEEGESLFRQIDVICRK